MYQVVSVSFRKVCVGLLVLLLELGAGKSSLRPSNNVTIFRQSFRSVLFNLLHIMDQKILKTTAATGSAKSKKLGEQKNFAQILSTIARIMIL